MAGPQATIDAGTTLGTPTNQQNESTFTMLTSGAPTDMH